MKKIWLLGLEKEMNCSVAFSYKLPDNCSNLYLKLAASNTFRVFVNDKFVFCGPVRTAHGYAVISQVVLNEHLSSADDYLTIEVASYHVDSFYTLDEDPFFSAEVYDGEKIVANCDDFQAYILDDRIQKVQRYSPQRPFVEAYKGYSRTLLYNGNSPYPVADTVEVEGKKLIEIDAPGCDFGKQTHGSVIEAGRVISRDTESPLSDRIWTREGKDKKGFLFSDLDVQLSNEVLSMDYVAQDVVSNKIICENEYLLLDYGRNITGFPELNVKVLEDTTLYFLFDEIIWDELYEQPQYADFFKEKSAKPLIFCRSNACNVIKWELTPGEYKLISFEPYTLQYGKAVVTKGSLELNSSSVNLFENTDSSAIFNCSDKELELIFKSAQNTYAQNAVDVLTDCPSRERAGWLCDSYFSGKAEKILTGSNKAENNLLTAYSLIENLPRLPEGMVPMCYPADTGNFIPNWALWYVIELESYFHRNNDINIINNSKKKAYGLINYFSGFENEKGMLENLTGWVFVEWSKASDFVHPVNIPSNILYYAMLKSASHLYNDEKLLEKAEKLKAEILSIAYDGKFFCDRLVRDDNGELVPTKDYSATCQYYAFYFGIATKQNFPELYKTIFNELWLNVKGKTAIENLHPANAFNGKYVCMLYLMETGKIHCYLDEIKQYLIKMSKRSRTLWELDESTASCCHGFAAVAANIIVAATVGFIDIDEISKTIILCEGFVSSVDTTVKIPYSEGIIEVSCIDGNRKITLPENSTYRIEILK